MRLAARVHLSLLLIVPACPGDLKATPDASASGTTAATSTTAEPTTSTTAEPKTATTTAVDASSGSSSSGAPMPVCAAQANADDCVNAGCAWTQVVQYTHGAQGCQGGLLDWCVPKDTSGGLSAVWRDDGGDVEVLQFPFDPTDLGPEWQHCGCDGPLACLCTAAPLDCPDRLAEFCGAITDEDGCNGAIAGSGPACGFFQVSSEGPNDGACDDEPYASVCLPATHAGADTCTKIPLPPYPNECIGEQDPIFWRDHDGILELTRTCGPVPIDWTQCADDPNQPTECRCACH